MINNNKAQFLPVMILTTVIELLPLVVGSIAAFINENIAVGSILLTFSLVVYITIFLLMKKGSSTDIYFVKVDNGELEISYANFTSADYGKVSLDDVVKIDYYRINSFVSWVLCLINVRVPRSAFLTYTHDGATVYKPIGYFAKKDIDKLCESNGIKVIMH